MSVRVRIAPSPTGLLHIGTVRTALFNYLFAKKNKGTYILRVEDTDKERSTKAFEENIITGLVDMGLESDEDPIKGGPYAPYRQSERTDLYKRYLVDLLERQAAYHCFCTPEALAEERERREKAKLPPRYNGKCRVLSEAQQQERIQKGERSVIRFKSPVEGSIEFEDLVRGPQSVQAKEYDDFVIAKNLDTPLYNYTVVVDDHTMDITHVIRGEDHLTNTPKQILMYRALGWEMPLFGHLPLILNEDRSKLSKRKNKVSVADYLEQGYLKDALINFLALIGWNPGTEEEIFSLAELAEKFDLSRVQKGGAVFDIKKLDWINSIYIRKLTVDQLTSLVRPYLENAQLLANVSEDYLAKIVALSQERLKFLSEIVEQTDFFFHEIPYEKSLLLGKGVTDEIARSALSESIGTLSNLERFDEEAIKESLNEVIQRLGLKNGQVLWPIRAALSGKQFSPGAFELLAIFGKDESIKRLQMAMEKLNA